MKTFIWIQAAVMLVGTALVAAITAPQNALSFLIGALIVFSNFLVILFAWKYLLAKKLIALSILLIVFKYAILGLVVYKVIQLGWVHPLWLALGVGTKAAAAALSAMKGQHGI